MVGTATARSADTVSVMTDWDIGIAKAVCSAGQDMAEEDDTS